MPEMPAKKPLAEAGLWGVGAAALTAIAGAVLSDCPQLASNWLYYITTGLGVAWAKFSHSGRSMPLGTILEIVRKLVAKESPNAAAVVVQAASVADVKAEAAKVESPTVKVKLEN